MSFLEKISALWRGGRADGPMRLPGDFGAPQDRGARPAVLHGDDRDYTPPGGAHRVWMGRQGGAVIVTPAIADACCFVNYLSGEPLKVRGSPYFIPTEATRATAKLLIGSLGELRPVIDVRILDGLWPGTDEPPPWEFNRLVFKSRDAWLKAGAPGKSPG